jgi:hypothetical protein
MCGMNVMWKAEYTVLMYHLLMGKRKSMLIDDPREDNDGLIKLPFDRFGDIWCGIIAKKIADHLGLSMSTGMPYIRHERASNPFTNLKKEANGIEVNEELWEHIHHTVLNGCKTPVECYSGIAESIDDFVLFQPKYKEYEEYFRTLAKAMNIWAELFAEKS